MPDQGAATDKKPTRHEKMAQANLTGAMNPNLAGNAELCNEVLRLVDDTYRDYSVNPVRKFYEQVWTYIDQQTRCKLTPEAFVTKIKQITRNDLVPTMVSEFIEVKTARVWLALFDVNDYYVKLRGGPNAPPDFGDQATSLIYDDCEADRTPLRAVRLFHNTFRFGNGFYEPFWNFRREWRRRRVQLTEEMIQAMAKEIESGGQNFLVLCQFFGMRKIMLLPAAMEIGATILEPITEMSPGWIVVDEFIPTGNRPSWRERQIQDVFLDPLVETLEDQDRVILRDKPNRDQILSLAMGGLYLNTANIDWEKDVVHMGDDEGDGVETAFFGNRGISSLEGSAGMPSRRRYERLRSWMRIGINPSTQRVDDSVAPDWYVVDTLNKSVVLQIRQRPYWMGDLPLGHTFHKPEQVGFYHQSDPEVLEPVFNGMTKFLNQAGENKDIASYPILVALKNAVDIESFEEIGPFKVVWEDQPGALREMRFSDNSAGQIQFINFLREFLESGAQMRRPVMGEPFPSHTTAEGVQQTSSAAAAPLNTQVHLIDETFLERLAHFFWELRAQFTDQPISVRTQSGQTVEITPDLFQHNFEVRTRGITEFEQRPARRQAVATLIQYLGQLQDPLILLAGIEKFIAEMQMGSDFQEDIGRLREWMQQQWQMQTDPVAMISQMLAQMPDETIMQIVQQAQAARTQQPPGGGGGGAPSQAPPTQ